MFDILSYRYFVHETVILYMYVVFVLFLFLRVNGLFLHKNKEVSMLKFFPKICFWLSYF